MIVAEQKPISEITRYLEKFQNITIAACGTCVTVCMAGGEKEANELASLLSSAIREENLPPKNINIVVPKRQCDAEFLDGVREVLEKADVVLSMGCGAGVQYMAEFLKNKPVFPALNTKFIGVARELGLWTEMCQGCGECLLERTGAICPVTRCSKSNLNGPCGGSSHGKCELGEDIDCAWQLIYDRLKELNALDRLYDIVDPKDWRTARDGGPRKVTRPDMMIKEDIISKEGDIF